MKPYVFKTGWNWAIYFDLGVGPTVWLTAQWRDALTFALNLAQLQSQNSEK